MDSVPKNHDRYWVPGLAKGLDVLNILADAAKPLTASEIAKRMGINRSAVFRLLYTLQYLDYLEEAPGGRGYELSARVLRLGYAYISGRDIAEVAKPLVEELARSTGLSAHLGTLSLLDIIYLIHAPGRSGYVSTIAAGDRLPAHATPLGLAILSGRSDEQLSAMFADQALERLTPQTPASLAEILELARQARAQGYVISHGAVHPGGQSAAAAIRNAAGEVKWAVGISGPDSAFAPGELESRYCPLVVDTAAKISRNLGYEPPDAAG